MNVASQFSTLCFPTRVKRVFWPTTRATSFSGGAKWGWSAWAEQQGGVLLSGDATCRKDRRCRQMVIGKTAAWSSVLQHGRTFGSRTCPNDVNKRFWPSLIGCVLNINTTTPSLSALLGCVDLRLGSDWYGHVIKNCAQVIGWIDKTNSSCQPGFR